MKKLPLKILIGIFVLALAGLSCGMVDSVLATPTAPPTYTPQPTYTPYPTLVPLPTKTPAQPDIVSVLTENGFVQSGKDDCQKASPCTDFVDVKHHIVAVVYGNGHVGYSYDYGDRGEQKVVDTIITKVNGQDVDDWINNNMSASISGGIQEGLVGNFDIHMKYFEADLNGPASIAILIVPIQNYNSSQS